MKVTATALRKTLFPALERALAGEEVEVTYKGKTVRLLAEQGGSKLDRLEAHPDFILGDPDSLIHSDPELLAEMEAEWEKEWVSL